MTSPLSALPHINGVLNLLILGFVLAGWRAIRRGDRAQHPRFMKAAVITGMLFVATYGLMTVMRGHQRFPGDDGVRTFFLIVLWTHTPLAVAVVPMVGRTVWLAMKQRWQDHKRQVRWTLPVWLYVTVTGLVVYVMNNWVRPPM